jgi:hypothetical protein
VSLTLVLPELGLPEVTEPDPVLLQALLSDYERELDGTPPDMETFLFGRAPIAIFRRIFQEGPKELPGESTIWVLLLSGYFGGVWLRAGVNGRPSAQTRRPAPTPKLRCRS